MRIAVVALVAILVGACNTEAGTYAHEVKVPGTSPTAGPASSPRPSSARSQVSFYFAPSPIGKPVGRTVLSPAASLPVAALCSAPIQTFQDGNAGPLFCSNGAIIIQAWRYFAPIDTHVMSLGPLATVTQVKAAINADFARHSTNPIEANGYELARAYNQWAFAFDYWGYVTGAG
jgi:hypothetical protein